MTQVPMQPAPQPQVVVVHAPVASHSTTISGPRVASAAGAAAAGTGGCGMLISLLVTAIVLVAVMVPMIATGVVPSSWIPGLGWDGSEPMICNGIGHESASDVTARLPGYVAFEIGGNCELRLDGVDIEAEQILEAGGNAHIVIQNSTLRAPEGLMLGGNVHLDMRNTTLIVDDVAIEVSGNARANLFGGRIEAGAQPFVRGGNGRINNRGTEVVLRAR